MNRREQIITQIKNSVRYGKRRQIEIIKIIDANENTVRKYLKDLSEDDTIKEVQKSDGTYYYSQEEGEEQVHPLPYADTTEVAKILQQIAHLLDIEETSSTKIKSNQDIFDLFVDFQELSSNNYYVLDNKENLNLFFSIFDDLVNRIVSVDSHMNNRDLTSIGIDFFFMASQDIHENWTLQKEHKDYHNLLVQRTDDMLDSIDNIEHLDWMLFSLLSSINLDKGKQGFISIVKSGNYSKEKLIENAFNLYTVNNELHELFEDLDDAKRYSDETTEEEIDEIKQEIKNVYLAHYS